MKHIFTTKHKWAVLIAITGFLNFKVHAQPIIVTIGGNGYGASLGGGGYSGDGGPATSAELFGPAGLAVDASGNVVIADAVNNRIRRITVADGKINTVAGNGYGGGTGINGGYTGDGGLADSAEFWSPGAVALDAAGNMYIADYGNAAIRKVDAVTHKISTFAGGNNDGYTGDGGLATAATMHEPTFVAVDKNGNVYVSDWGNNVIRKITASTGKISTVAGDGEGAGFGGGSGNYTGDGGPADSASLNGPEGIAVDNAGNIYIGDASNAVIRKVDGTTNKISTYAGIGISSYGGDGGPADSAGIGPVGGLCVDAAGNLFVADQLNHAIRRIDAVTHIITTVAGNFVQGFSGDNGPATSAHLNGPAGVAVDAAGNLYISDTGNERIRKVIAHPAAVDNVQVNTGMMVYPNPSKGAITVKLNGTGYTSLKIFNELGQQVYNQALNGSMQNENLQIDMNSFVGGVYFLQLTGETNTLSKEIIVQR